MTTVKNLSPNYFYIAVRIPLQNLICKLHPIIRSRTTTHDHLSPIGIRRFHLFVPNQSQVVSCGTNLFDRSEQYGCCCFPPVLILRCCDLDELESITIGGEINLKPWSTRGELPIVIPRYLEDEVALFPMPINEYRWFQGRIVTLLTRRTPSLRKMTLHVLDLNNLQKKVNGILRCSQALLPIHWRNSSWTFLLRYIHGWLGLWY